MTQYSEQFKQSMVAKMSGPAARSASALAEEVGVTQSTLSRWLREYGRMGEGGRMKSRRPQDWSVKERLEAIIEYEKLGEEERGEFLRKRGVHEANLEKWKEELVSAGEQQGKNGRAVSEEKKRVRELEKELRKKDKALAETAALLVLKKKVTAIWGDREDEK